MRNTFRQHYVGLCALALSPISMCAAQAGGGRGGARAEVQQSLQYDLAFDRRVFPFSMLLAITPDGKRIAYEVRRPPDANVATRFLSSGTPSFYVGTNVYVTERPSGRTTQVCSAGGEGGGGTCWRPSWSPDGQTLAFYSDSAGSPQLWVFDVRTSRAGRLNAGVVKVKLWTGDEPKWSPDGKTVYVPMAPEGPYRSPVRPTEPRRDNAAGVTVLRSGGETKDAPPTEQPIEPRAAHYMRENLVAIAAVDVASGAARIIVPAASKPPPSVIRVSPSGRWVSYLSVFSAQSATNPVPSHDLVVVCASSGAPHLVVEDLPVLVDYHRLNYSWHPSEDRLVYLEDGKLWVVDLRGDSATSPRQLGESVGPLVPSIHWFTRDGRAVVVGTDPTDDRKPVDIRPRGIAVIPLDGGPPIRFAIDHARWEFQSIVKADDRTVWQPDNISVPLVLLDRATGELGVVRFEPTSGQSRVLWKGLARLENLTSTTDHSTLFGTYEDVRTPPDIYAFRAEFSSKERVSHIEPRLDRVGAGTAEFFETTVPAHDGRLTKVRTAVLLPQGAKRGDRLPAIVMIYPRVDVSRQAAWYGGSMTATVPTLLFTSRGYAVLFANLPLGRDGEAGNPIQEMIDALLPQVYRAAELGYIDADRVAVIGQSFGGYGTAGIISRTNLFRAAAAISGIYDLPGTYGHMGPDGGSSWIGWAEGGQARMGTHPWADVRRYIDNSPYYQADKILTPLLIVHGTDDGSYHDAQKLFTALRRLNRPAVLASYSGQGHVIFDWDRASAIDVAQRIVAFFQKYIGESVYGTP